MVAKPEADMEAQKTTRTRLAGIIVSRGAIMSESPRAVAALINYENDDARVEIADIGTPAWDEATGGLAVPREEAAQLNYIINKHNTTKGPLTTDETDAVLNEIKDYDAFHHVHAVTSDDAKQHWAHTVKLLSY